MKVYAVKLLAVLNVAGYMIMIVVNILANTLPINGVTTGEVSNMYPNLFTPASFTFSIWGLIYILLALFTVYQTGVLSKGKTNALAADIGWLFFISSLANTAWIFMWHYKFIFLSAAVMLILLLSLIGIYIRLSGRKAVSSKEKFFAHLPFSVYLGWISVATIANIAALLVSVNWNGFGIPEEIWTIFVIILAAVLGSLFVLKKKDIAYGLVIIWAFIGIIIKHLDYYKAEYKGIIITVIIVTAIIGIEILKTYRKRLKAKT